MNRTRTIFIAILALAVVIVIVSLFFTNRGSTSPDIGLTVARPETVKIRILTALPVEPWVRRAAEEFNAGDNLVDGVPIEVEVVAVDGLTALGRWDRNEYGALEAGVRPEDLSADQQQALEGFPTAWIPDCRYLVELANASYKERLGRDVFLTDGEYRARPIAISLFAWGLYASRAGVLEERFGEIDWQAIHDAAVATWRLARTRWRRCVGLFQVGSAQSQQKCGWACRHDLRGRRILWTHRHQRRRCHQPRISSSG